MACEACRRFPAPTSRFEEVGVDDTRHTILYRCKVCETFYEISEGKGAPELTRDEVIRRYPQMAESID